MIKNRIKQAYMLIKSVLIKYKLNLLYGNHIELALVNSIKGRLKIELKDGASCSIGKFLMSAGPLYIKCEGNASITIGNNCFFNHNCSITSVSSITIGDRCNFANNVIIVDHDHKIGHLGVEEGYNTAEVTIGNNVWIGANVTILRGVTIGDGAVIAAGAVVNCDISQCELWGGLPAKLLKKL